MSTSATVGLFSLGQLVELERDSVESESSATECGVLPDEASLIDNTGSPAVSLRSLLGAPASVVGLGRSGSSFLGTEPFGWLAGWLATGWLFKNRYGGAATKSRVVSTTNSNAIRSIKTAH